LAFNEIFNLNALYTKFRAQYNTDQPIAQKIRNIFFISMAFGE